MRSFQLQRLGIVMDARARIIHTRSRAFLTLGAARGPDGQLYLFPRLVARGNFSRIGVARVQFNGKGDPVGVERVGIALEPQADYELHPGGGGCEDPRVTFVEPLATLRDDLHRPRMQRPAHRPCDLQRFVPLGTARTGDIPCVRRP